MKNYLGMKIDPKLKTDLEKLAEKENRSLSNFVKMILRNYVTLKLKRKTK
jgi:predicted transcriptional regulator